MEIGDSRLWELEGRDKLVKYNLHYFDDLTAINHESRASIHQRLIERWIKENPRGMGVGWDAYPTSLRLVNWIKLAMSGKSFVSDEMNSSIFRQADWVFRRLEYHLMGNHLLANAKALCFSGAYFSCDQSTRWWHRGLNIILEQIKEQILDDGAHFELSPMYQLIVLEDLLDLHQLFRNLSEPMPPLIGNAISKMLAWSKSMRHPDGGIPFFNDATFGVAPSPNTLDRYASILGYQLSENDQQLVHHASSGYICMRTGQATLFADLANVGPSYLPGHGHADTLSFELSVATHRVVVNSGVSTYAVSEKRLEERSTGAHSSIVIDGESSSEVWSGFRVARRATILNAISGQTRISKWCRGAHDGYKRFGGDIVHDRIFCLKQDKLNIVDNLQGQGEHTVEIVLPLGPEMIPKVIKPGKIFLFQRGRGNYFCQITFSSKARLEICQSGWNFAFGKVVPTSKLVIHARVMFPFRHKLVLSWSQ